MKVTTIAREIDTSARRFYEEMAELATRSEHSGVARIFRMLAEDEAKLLEQHRALATQDRAYESKVLDRSANVFEELRHREDQLDISDDIAAYRLAIEAEQELLRRFRKAAEEERHTGSRKLLDKLVREEARHLKELEGLYDFANAPNNYLAWGEFSNLDEFGNFGREMV